MNHHERLALFNLGADFLDFRHADGVVDLVARVFFAGTEKMDAAGNHSGVDRVHVAAFRRGELADVFCRREFFRMIDERGVATLSLDQILKFLEGGAIGQVTLDGLLGGERGARHAG